MTLSLMLVASGCETPISTDDVKLIDVAAAERALSQNSGLLGMGNGKGAWVDPRPAGEFAKGHIPGAINIPFEHIEDSHQQLNDYKTVVVYGDNFGDWRAEGATKRLLILGHGRVRMLKGGLRAWTTAGNDLESGG